MAASSQTVICLLLCSMCGTVVLLIASEFTTGRMPVARELHAESVSHNSSRDMVQQLRGGTAEMETEKSVLVARDVHAEAATYESLQETLQQLRGHMAELEADKSETEEKRSLTLQQAASTQQDATRFVQKSLQYLVKVRRKTQFLVNETHHYPDLREAWELQQRAIMGKATNGTDLVSTKLAEQNAAFEQQHAGLSAYYAAYAEQQRYAGLAARYSRLAKQADLRSRQLESEAALMEANASRVSAQLSAVENQTQELRGFFQYAMGLGNWSFKRNGTSTCGMFSVQVQDDLINQTEAQHCSAWCKTQLPLWNWINSWFGAMPTPWWLYPGKVLVELGNLAGKAPAWLGTFGITYLKFIICAFFAVAIGYETFLFTFTVLILPIPLLAFSIFIPWVLAVVCYLLWFGVLRWLLLVLSMPILGAILLAYLLPMALLGKPSKLCAKVESATLAGALPRSAGPLAGGAVVATGVLLFYFKRRFCTELKKLGSKQSLHDELDDLSIGGESKDMSFMVIGIQFEEKEEMIKKTTATGTLRQGDITDLLNAASAQRFCGPQTRVVELHLHTENTSPEASATGVFAGDYQKLAEDVQKISQQNTTINQKQVEEEEEEEEGGEDEEVTGGGEIGRGEVRRKYIGGLALDGSPVTLAKCIHVSTRTFSSSSKTALLNWLSAEGAKDTVFWDTVSVIRRPESKGLALTKGHGGTCSMVTNLISDLFLLLPATDNYSDVAQTVSFLRKGQPFYCCYNFVGILWNVILNLERTPPVTEGGWYALEVVGRLFQADVIEATAQSLRAGGKTQMFYEKAAIQASTESVQNLMIILLAILQSGSWRETGVGLHLPWKAADTALQYLLDFVLVSGDLGMMSNLLLSLLSIYGGLGEAPQWVLEFERQRSDEAFAQQAEANFKPL